METLLYAVGGLGLGAILLVLLIFRGTFRRMADEPVIGN